MQETNTLNINHKSMKSRYQIPTKKLTHIYANIQLGTEIYKYETLYFIKIFKIT